MTNLLLMLLFVMIMNKKMFFYLKLSLFKKMKKFFFMKYEFKDFNQYFLLMLMVCLFMSSYFYWHYFSWSSDKLMFLIQLFLFVMIYLMKTKSLLKSLISWEYLGIVSFFLILYYNVYSSSYSASVTLTVSRLGDLGLFLLMVFNLKKMNKYKKYFLMFLMVVLIGSKSAFYPLSGWLLEAMRAPTPVSSLVHSSTLVAAGFWLFKNYIYYFNEFLLKNIMLLICLVSMVMSGLCASFYYDMKKMMALSTCKNMSWCFLYLLKGFSLLGLMQLVSHGMAKCSLFCSMGDSLTGSNLNQNKGSFFFKSNSKKMFNITFLSFMMSGLPFMGIFFSKHLLYSLLLTQKKFFICFLTMLSFTFSFIYSIRLISMLSKNSFSKNKGFVKKFNLISMILLISLLMKWFFSENLFEDKKISLNSKMYLLLMVMISSIMGLNLSLKFKNWLKSFLGQDWFYYFFMKLYKTMFIKFKFFLEFRWELFLWKNLNSKKFLMKNMPITAMLMLFFVGLLVFI